LIHYLYIDFSTSWIVLDNMEIKNDDDDDDDDKPVWPGKHLPNKI
jgi:hypothetical protein